MHVSACLPHVKLKNWHAHELLHTILPCARLPVNTSERDMSDARHKLALGLPYYTCGVQVQ